MTGGEGFVYAATGERYVREAMRSRETLRRHHPSHPVLLFTDRADVVPAGAFDDVIELPAQQWKRSSSKVWALGRSPFDKTVYLDTDVHVVGDLADLFRVLDRFDAAGVPMELRVQRLPGHADDARIPDAFMSVNAGVLAYRRNDATAELFARWAELYEADRATAKVIQDQPSLRAALWESRCSLLLLPPEFNMRTIRGASYPNVAVGTVRVIHGRVPDLARLERRWNRTTEPRLLTPLPGYVGRVTARRVLGARAYDRLRAVQLRRSRTRGGVAKPAE